MSLSLQYLSLSTVNAIVLLKDLVHKWTFKTDILHTSLSKRCIRGESFYLQGQGQVNSFFFFFKSWQCVVNVKSGGGQVEFQAMFWDPGGGKRGGRD